MAAEVTIEGRRFLLERMDARAAWEVECILLGVLGPGLSMGLGVMAEPLLDRLAEHVRTHLRTPTPRELESEEQPPAFDLARLSTMLDTLDTSGSVVQGMAESMLDSAGPLVGRALDTAAPVLIEQLGWDRIRRLVELALIGPAFVFVEDEPRRLTDWKALDAATRRSWSAKWRLLVEALRAHFRDESEAEG